MPNHYLLAVDPGKVTGFALLNISEMTNEISPRIISTYELSVPGFQHAFDSFLRNYCVDPIEVVIEEYKITAATAKLTEAPWSLKNIGVVEFLCRERGLPLTEQPPSRAKNFVPNDRLQALGLWHKGGAGHANDALRHAVLYLVENHDWRPSKLLDSDAS